MRTAVASNSDYAIVKRNPMTMFHGTTLYAVHSRDVGTFGGRAARATIKIYDTRDCGTPRLTISGETVAPTLAMLRDCKKVGRDAIQAYLTSAIAHISPARGDHLKLAPEEYRRRHEAANAKGRSADTGANRHPSGHCLDCVWSLKCSVQRCLAQSTVLVVALTTTIPRLGSPLHLASMLGNPSDNERARVQWPLDQLKG